MQANCKGYQVDPAAAAGRPVVLPNSLPVYGSIRPFHHSAPSERVRCPPGCNTLWIRQMHLTDFWGAIPNPVQTPAEMVLLLIYKGEGSEIDVQHAALRSFSQHRWPFCIRSLMKYSPFTILKPRRIDGLKELFLPGADVFLEIEAIEQPLMFETEFDVFRRKTFIEQVAYPQNRYGLFYPYTPARFLSGCCRSSGCLWRVRWPYPGYVCRQDQVRAFADEEFFRKSTPSPLHDRIPFSG